jgi:hypothetical protein
MGQSSDDTFKSILDIKAKIPTARQIQNMLKNEWHKWTPIEKTIAAIILLPSDLLVCSEDENSTRRRMGDSFPKNYEDYKAKAHRRLAYLDSILENQTIAIENYEYYKYGIKKPTGKEEFPPDLAWSIRRRNAHQTLMRFINEIDARRK